MGTPKGHTMIMIPASARMELYSPESHKTVWSSVRYSRTTFEALLVAGRTSNDEQSKLLNRRMAILGTTRKLSNRVNGSVS